MTSIFYEIINEANIGRVVIDGDIFNIAFNTIIYNKNKQIFNNVVNDNYPTLLIKEESTFLYKLALYVNLVVNKNRKLPSFCSDVQKNRIKIIIAYIFASATTEDFINPIKLLDRNIAFLCDDTFECLNEPVCIKSIETFYNSSLRIQNTHQSIYMETPNRIDIALMNYDFCSSYELPSISYGIVKEDGEKVCYIYTIMNLKNKKEQNSYTKKIARELYKLNSNVSKEESEECSDGIYIENISDVSPSSILSLTIFVSLLSKQNITKIKVVPYLPIRYLSREISACDNDDLNERNICIQRNATDKFLRTFRRLNYHSKDFKIVSFPYELSEYMEIILSQNSQFNNDILESVYRLSKHI